MPLYEYLCNACRQRFEVIRKFSDPPLEICPSCGGTVQKLQSAPAIQFKGSGWYITDYAKKEHTDAAKADSAAQNASDGKDGGKEKTEKNGTEKSGAEKSGAEKSGAEKSGAEKSGAEKSGAEKSGARKS